MRLPRSASVSFPPLQEEFRGYGFAFLKGDLWAALAVALLTIPQSIAYSLLAGLPPTAGLFSAIFGTIFAASLGSSRCLISGPSTGTAILIQTSIADCIATYHDGVFSEGLVLQLLTQIVLVMGLIQLGAAFFNIAKLLQFVSRSVVLGYFAGILVAIVVTQLHYFVGVPSKASGQAVLLQAWAFLLELGSINYWTTFIGVLSLATLLVLRRFFQRLPHPLIMLAVAAIAAYLVDNWAGEPMIARLKDFRMAKEPLPVMTFPFLDLSLLNQIFPAAVAISFLSVLEVFSVSRTFASRVGSMPQVNQDVFGLSIANLFLSFISGSLPASGSATRTSLSVHLGSKTRLAAIFSGIFTAILIFFLWPLVADIPLAALAALLMVTVPTIMNWQEIKLTLRATRSDALVFIITFLSTLLFSLDVAFFIGIVMSIATYLKKSSTPHLVEYAFNTKGRLVVVTPKEDAHRKIRVIGIAGELYFASADIFQSALQSIAEDPNVQVIVLRLNNVYHMDASMCLALQRLYETLHAGGRYLLISGLTEEIWHVFHRTGIVKQIGPDNLYFADESNPQFSTWKACMRAQELIHKN